MSIIKISEMTQAAELTSADAMPLVNNGITKKTLLGDLADWVLKVYLGYDGGTVQDALNLAKDGAIFAGKYLAADGVTDDSANLLSALTSANGKKLVFPYRSTVYLASPVNYEGSIDIDLNGSRIVAPNRALRVQKIKNTDVSASPLLSFVKGNRRFEIPVGMTFAAGDYVEFLSNTVYEVAGQNKYGHACTILSVAGGLAELSHPLLEAFDVNTINVYEGYTGRIINGVVDQSGFADPGTFLSTAVPQECVSFRGASFEFDNLTLIGNDYTAVGLYAQATVVRGVKSYGYGHLNVTGFGTTGRLGYGILVHGQDVVLDQCGGANCKHVLMTGSRIFLDGKVTFIAPVCWSPPFGWNSTVSPPSGTQTKWGAPIDSHAGCSEFVVVDPTVHGANSLINVRNRKAKIIRPVLHHYGSISNPGNTFVICAFEGPVQLHEIIDPVLYLNEPSDLSGSALPYLYGLQTVGNNEVHGSVVIRNPRFENGGGVFATVVSQDQMDSTLKSVEITGIQGKITDGVRVSSIFRTEGGVGADRNLWAKVSRVVVSFDNVDYLQRYGVTDGVAVDLTNISDIDELVKITGRVNVHPVMTTTSIAIEIGEQGKAFKMPPVIDLDGLKLQAPKGGVYIRTTDTRVIQRLVLDNAEILHALNESGTATAHGLSLERGAALGKRATFIGSRILKNGSIATNSKAINANGADLDPSGLIVEGDIPDIGSLANFPIGLRHINWTNVPITGIGGAEVYSTDGRRIFCTAVPPTRFSGIPAGTRVQRATPTTSGAQEWMFTGAGWVAVLTL